MRLRLLNERPSANLVLNPLKGHKRKHHQFLPFSTLVGKETNDTTTTTTDTAQKACLIQVRSNRRTSLIFGANTDVGKSIVSAGLARASLSHNKSVHYIKPLQSGGGDDQFIQRYAWEQPRKSTSTTTDISTTRLSTKVLFSWKTPASPHLASRIEGQPCSDEEFLSALHSELTKGNDDAMKTRRGEYLTMLIETAGGVLSPAAASPGNQSPRHARTHTVVSAKTDDSEDAESLLSSSLSWGWQPQADLYQPLLGQCPVVLVGDGRLGGISATLSALESLLLRGYDVAAVVFLETSEHSQNAAALSEYVAGRAFQLRSGSGQALLTPLTQQSIVSLPPIPMDPNEPLDDWFATPQVSQSFAKLDQYLQASWEGQVLDLQSLRREGRQVLWWPFTQHGKIDTDDAVTLVDSASGDYYNILTTETTTVPTTTTTKSHKKPSVPSSGLERTSLFDACGSWWTQGIGHGDSSLSLSAAAAAGRYGHVSFPDVVHAPAVALCQKLLGPNGPGHKWANRVFFTDNGASSMEVAVKMAMKTYQTRHDMSDDDMEEFHWDCIGRVGAYHGDTLGVMNLSEPSIFNEGQHPWYEPRVLFLEPPTIGRLSVCL